MRVTAVVLILVLLFAVSATMADTSVSVVISTFSDVDEITLSASTQIGEWNDFDFYVDGLYATKVDRFGLGASVDVPDNTPVFGTLMRIVNAERGGASVFFPKISDIDFSDVDWAFYIIPKFASFEF